MAYTTYRMKRRQYKIMELLQVKYSLLKRLIGAATLTLSFNVFKMAFIHTVAYTNYLTSLIP